MENSIFWYMLFGSHYTCKHACQISNTWKGKTKRKEVDVITHDIEAAEIFLRNMYMYYHNNNNNCLKSNIQCIEIRVQWTVHLIDQMCLIHVLWYGLLLHLYLLWFITMPCIIVEQHHNRTKFCYLLFNSRESNTGHVIVGSDDTPIWLEKIVCDSIMFNFAF